ncbi:MAG: transposase [Acidimicrobiales bacterium]|nr:transposase [Acidimicrobiales bacterium]
MVGSAFGTHQECLDRLLILGRTHLEQVLAEDLTHYNDHRPHRSLDEQAPRTMGVPPHPIDKPDPARLRRKAVLGGLIHEYRLAA